MKVNKIRLQKHLSECGIASRRKAEELIAAGKVKINGHIAEIGAKVDPKRDKVTVRGKAVVPVSEKVYIMLNKPRGFVTTMSDELGRKTVSDLVADAGARLFPVGRLDRDSEGLLIMTNDGDFANALMHPKHEVNKTYHVTVTDFAPDKLQQLGQPVTLDGYTIRKPAVKLLKILSDNRALLSVTIHEGRNRQVRRMCDLAGMQVTRLIRVSEGVLNLGTLPSGKWRYLTAREVQSLQK